MKSVKTKLHYTSIDLNEELRVKINETLSLTLAAAFDLQSQVKQAHWNVKGKDFYQLHLLFDELAGEVAEYVDLVAERITTLGGTALGTVRVAASKSILEEYPSDIAAGEDHIKALVARYAKFGAHVRSCIDSTQELGDADTADIYTEISRGIDKRLWFLEAHIQE